MGRSILREVKSSDHRIDNASGMLSQSHTCNVNTTTSLKLHLLNEKFTTARKRKTAKMKSSDYNETAK